MAQERRRPIKITLNTIEMAGLRTKIRQWEEETGEGASIEFVMTLLSGIVSDDLEALLGRVFDIKRQIREDMEREDDRNR